MTTASSVGTVTPVSDRTAYSPEVDLYTVREIDNLALTTKDNRSLPLKIYLPEGDGPFPVVVFSHGTGASKDNYSELGEFWASRGYISIHPSHVDSLARRGLPMNLRNLRRTLDEVLNDSTLWVSRAEDIALVVDSLAEIERQSSQLRGKIDPDRVGVSGHSFGAYAAQVASGASISLPGNAGSFSLPAQNIKATLLLSPQGSGQQGLTRESWRRFQAPMMVMTGPQDEGAQGQDYTWKTEPFELSPATSNRYLVLLDNANHFSFGGRARENARFGRRQARTFNYIKLASLAFWDTHLSGNEQAQDYLLDEISEISDREVTVDFR